MTLGNVKTQKFSDVWDASLEPSAAELQKLRGAEDPLERQKLLSGSCATCKHFALCGGGFRTRAAFANGHWYGSDPGCYLTDEERQTEITL